MGMKLNCYFKLGNQIKVQNPVSGYFIERFLYFNFQKKTNYNFTYRFFSYNSNIISYFHSLQQCFFKVKLEKSKFLKNLVSRINLLKLRFEYPNFETSQIFKSNRNRNNLKIYGSLNNLPLVPDKINIIAIIKIKIVLKKLFFKKYKTIIPYWFFFFEKVVKNYGKNTDDFHFLTYYVDLNLNGIPGKKNINKLISYSKNHSWITGFINLLNYKRKFYHKKNTIIYIRTGLLRLSQFSFVGYLIHIKKKKNRFSKLKLPLSFSVDPIFNQNSQNLRISSTNLFSNGVYCFRILASKKKLPLKIFSPLSNNKWIYNLVFIDFFKKISIKKVILKYVSNQNNTINYHCFFISDKISKKFYFHYQKKEQVFNQLIVKEALDFNNEIGAIFLLSQFEKILREYQINVWLNPLSFNSYCFNGGSIEVIPNSNSIHEIKSCTSLNNLLSLLQKRIDKRRQKHTIKKFLESMAGYSLVCYILQIKDRHNANILLNKDNRLIHVDFAFILGSLPGNLKLEAMSFKMSKDFVNILKGETTQSFDLLKEVFARGFLILRKNIGKIIKISKFFIFEGRLNNKTRRRLFDLVERLKLTLNDFQCVKFCHKLFKDSLEDWRTNQYDKYQNLANGIKI